MEDNVGNGDQGMKDSMKRQQPNTVSSSKKMKKDDLYKAPSAEEISDLKEAEMMYHSSLFRLQAGELMNEVQIKPKFKSSLKSWMESLKEFLLKIPASEKFQLHDRSWIGKDVKIPIVMKPRNQRGFFQFFPPSKVIEVGSYALDTICELNPVIDIALAVPKECWQKTDVLNFIYHKKRALYLTYLAKCLKGHALVEKMEFALQNDCHVRPVLQLSPAGKLGNHVTVRLLPYPEDGTFKLTRFIPERNNVRKSWFFGKDASDEDTNIPTPFYNATILQDVLLPSLAEFLTNNITSQSLKEGIIMLKVWCLQREIYQGCNGLSGFIFSMLVSYLLAAKKLNPLMSSYQVFRITLLALSKDDWATQGITLAPKLTDLSSLDSHRQYRDVVFIDPSGVLNLCYSLHEVDSSRVKHEAAIAIKILDSNSCDSFAYLFLNKVPFSRKFEGFIRLTNSTKWKSYCEKLNADDTVLDYGADYISCIIPRLCQTLKKGLGNRITLIGNAKKETQKWEVHKKLPDFNSTEVMFGLLYDQDFVYSNLEKGPAADNPEAREFQSFWGEKSELRRFKDGSINEAVFWPAETLEDKRLVLASIVKYILSRHVGVAGEDIVFSGNNIDSTLHVPKQLYIDHFSAYGTGEELFVTMHQSFNSLASQLRKLDALPLAVSSVQGVSPSFRFSEVFPPFSRMHFCNRNVVNLVNGSLTILEDNQHAPVWVSPLKVIVHFESSGKWPNDADAMKRAKAAMHLKIAELLTSKFSLSTQPTASFVDVFKDGYVFRLEVACHKEISLLKQTKAPDGMVKIKDTPESQKLEFCTEILPKLNGILHGIHQQHNSFGTACRLAKRWISSQLLQNYISDIIVELIMAHIYIHPEPYTCPSSPQLAFQRFLELLCTFDWATNGFIINFNDEITQADLADIASQISSQRTNLPAMVIVTPMDKSGCLFTKDEPSLLILKRLILLAKVSLTTLEEQLQNPQTADFKQIFRPPLNPYDVIIHLNKKQNPKAHLALDESEATHCPSYEPYQKKAKDIMPVVGYDPITFYLKDLRESYSDFAMFFYDVYGGDYIAVLWKPDAFKSRPFKVSNINGHFISGTNADGSVNILPSVEAILEGFDLLGKGLVKNITNQTEKWKIG